MNRLTLCVLGFVAALALPAAAQTTAPSGFVFTSTNEPAGNQVAVYARAPDGVVTFDRYVATGGKGTGAGLGNQGAVVLSDDERFLFVVNAGSNDLTVFALNATGLDMVDIVPTGETPVSVAQRGSMVYVVNATSSTVQGFRQAFDGQLMAIPGAVGRLSGLNVGPAQIAISPDGFDLYVTERATNLISQFRLDSLGAPVTASRMRSPGMTPFGFKFGLRNQVVVSEAAGGAAGASTTSSYRRRADGQLELVTQSLAAGETANCWIEITPNGRFAFGTNTASDSVTSFAVAFDGQLSVLNPQAALTGVRPLDMAISRDSRFFYVLAAGTDASSGGIGDYRLEPDGALVGLPGTNTGLPSYASGLAVR